MSPFLLVQAGNPPQDVRSRFGTFAEMFAPLLGTWAPHMQVVRVYANEALPPPHEVSGALITGSPGNVTDGDPWMREAADWVRAAFEQELPLLGVCFGHQLMAHALGGQVDYHPRGREVGTWPIELLPEAQNDPWLSEFPQTFPAQLLHEQTVMSPPPGAVVLGRNQHDAHQILRYTPRAMSVQFHPEFTKPIMESYLEVMEERLSSEGHSVPQLRERLSETPHAQATVAAFLRSCDLIEH